MKLIRLKPLFLWEQFANICWHLNLEHKSNYYQTMDVSGASGKSKTKVITWSKSKYNRKTQKQRDLLPQPPPSASSSSSSGASSASSSSSSVELLRNLITTMVTREKSITNYCNHLNINLRIIMSGGFEWQICTRITILSCLISLVKAYSNTTAATTSTTPVVKDTEYAMQDDDDLVVCLPLNSSSCVTFVNSSINGLIELNETIYPALKAFRGSYDFKMIARVNPFWLTFEPPSDTCYFVMGTLYMFIFIFGATGNGLVIYMFARCKALRKPSNILVFNLAVSDIMIILMCPMAAYNNFMRGPALGDWACRMYGFIGGFSGTTSIGMLTVISLDRYSVVVNPLSPIRFTYKSNYYYVLLSIVWLDALFFSILPLFGVGLSLYVPEGYLTTCSFDYLDKSMQSKVFMFVFFICAWALPLALICYCYFHILKVVLTSDSIQSNKNKQQVEARLALMVLLIIGLWFLAWTPYALIAMAGVFGQEQYLTPTRSMIPALFCKTASCFNPVLYTISHKRFRSEFQRVFFKRPLVYQHSMTRSSNITRSTRRTRNRVDLCNDGEGRGEQSAYKMELNACRKNLRSKMSIESIEVYPSGYGKRGSNQYTNYSRSVNLPEDKSIFVLDVDPAIITKSASFSTPQSMETIF